MRVRPALTLSISFQTPAAPVSLTAPSSYVLSVPLVLSEHMLVFPMCLGQYVIIVYIVFFYVSVSMFHFPVSRLSLMFPYLICIKCYLYLTKIGLIEIKNIFFKRVLAQEC